MKMISQACFLTLPTVTGANCRVQEVQGVLGTYQQHQAPLPRHFMLSVLQIFCGPEGD